MIVGVNWSELEPSYRVGVYYGLAAAVFYAAFILSLRKLQADQMGAPPFFVLLLVSLSTAVFSKTDISGELAGGSDRPGSHLPGYGRKIGGRRSLSWRCFNSPWITLNYSLYEMASIICWQKVRGRLYPARPRRLQPPC